MVLLMSLSSPFSPIFDSPAAEKSASMILPTLIEAYHEQGYEAGHRRGLSDALVLYLEAAERFVADHPESAADIRRLLREFTDPLETYLARPDRHFYFVDGSGV
jgi:iron-sulfur cluster repair protein YtfE (RIC family)